MEEKRKSRRVRSNAVATFKVQSARLAGGSRIKDISETGVCLPSKHYFPIAAILELEIRSDDLNEPVKVLAKVVRVVKRDKGVFPFEVGLVFFELSAVNKDILHHFIRSIAARGESQDVSWID